MRSKQAITLVAALVLASYSVSAAGVDLSSAEQPHGCSQYASIPLPMEAERTPVPKAPPDCASYRSYQGIGRPVNYAETRACAWQERLAKQAELGQNPQQPIAWVVGGSLILANLYINGAGVERNVPLALRFACEAEEGMAKLALREIEKDDGPRRSSTRFEFCDYAASTVTMNFCSRYESEIGGERRRRYYSALKTSMTPGQRAAFDKLLTAKSAYVAAHTNEVYQGGTMRGIRTTSSQNALEDLFRRHLERFESRKWPAHSSRQIQIDEAQRVLAREYKETVQKLGRRSLEDVQRGAVSAVSVAKAQEAWNVYRETWVEFARLRYPVYAGAIHAEIILERYRLLKTIR